MGFILDFIFGLYDQFVGWKQSRRIEGDLKQPYVYFVDLGRLAAHITCRTMFSDFREKYNLRERKAHKVVTLLDLLSVYYSALERGLQQENYGLLANTVIRGSLISFYAQVENTCVQPPQTLDLEAEWRRYPDILQYVLDDLREVFGGEIPWGELGSIGTLLKLPHLTDAILSRAEIGRRSQLANSAIASLMRQLMDNRRCLRQEAYVVPHLRVFEAFEEVQNQVITLQSRDVGSQTELVQKVLKYR